MKPKKLPPLRIGKHGQNKTKAVLQFLAVAAAVSLAGCAVSAAETPFRPAIARLELDRPQVLPGQTLQATYTFQSSGSAPTDLTVFVHIVRPDGRHIGADFEPDLPRTDWPQNGFVREGPFPISVPDDAAPGEYQIWVGLFSPQGEHGSSPRCQSRICFSPVLLSSTPLGLFCKAKGGFLFAKMPWPCTMCRMNSKESRTYCVRCGECCLKSSATLQAKDLTLVSEGFLRMEHLYTIRRGELVRDNVEGGLIPAEQELVKVREKEAGGACLFYEEAKKACTIYDKRPEQ